MFKHQVYNTVWRGRGDISPNNKPLHQIYHSKRNNVGILNTFRSSNNSSPFRMGKTSLSNDRFNFSKDRQKALNQNSGLSSRDQIHHKSQNRQKMMSILNIGRRKMNKQSLNQAPIQKSNGKNIVENIYMLDTNHFKNNRREESNIHKMKKTQKQLILPQSSQNHKKITQLNRQVKEQKVIQRKKRLYQNKKDRQKINEDNKKIQQKYYENVYFLNDRKKRQQTNDNLSNNSQSKHSISTKNQTKYLKTSPFSTNIQTNTNIAVQSVEPQIIKSSEVVFTNQSMKNLSSRDDINPKVQRVNIKRDYNKLQKSKPKQIQYQLSSLSVRWKINNIQFQERKEDYLFKKNQKIIEQIEQATNHDPFLPTESKQQVERQWAEEISEKISLHLQFLNLIANYAKQFRQIYDSTQRWQVLIFLTYKKFYIQRAKVAKALKLSKIENNQQQIFQIIQNPFILPYSKIKEDEIIKYRNTNECIRMLYEIDAQNMQIRNALRGLYNLYIQKTSQYFNMFDNDDFSEEIYRLMLKEIAQLSQNLNDQTTTEANKIRIGKIIKVGFLIAYLNGKYVKNFAQILIHEDTVQEKKREILKQDYCAKLYLQQFKKTLS